MNKKGQTFLLFVVLIPIFVMCFAYIFDTSFILYEKNNLKDIAILSKEYLESGKSYEEVKKFILKNDKNIKIESLNKKIILKKNIPSYFGNVIGYDDYEILINLE